MQKSEVPKLPSRLGESRLFFNSEESAVYRLKMVSSLGSEDPRQVGNNLWTLATTGDFSDRLPAELVLPDGKGSLEDALADTRLGSRFVHRSYCLLPVYRFDEAADHEGANKSCIILSSRSRLGAKDSSSVGLAFALEADIQHQYRGLPLQAQLDAARLELDAELAVFARYLNGESCGFILERADIASQPDLLQKVSSDATEVAHIASALPQEAWHEEDAVSGFKTFDMKHNGMLDDLPEWLRKQLADPSVDKSASPPTP